MTIIFIWTMFSVVLIGRYDHTADMLADPLYMESVIRFEKTIPCICVLMQIMTLDEWMVVLEPIFVHHPWSYGYFLVYVSMAGFAMMNLVTATVIEAGRKYSQREQFSTEVDKNLCEIGEIYRLAEGKSSQINHRSFRSKYRKCFPLLKLLEICCIPETAEALDELFELLDVEEKGSIDCVELALNLRVLDDYVKSPAVAATFRGMETLSGRFRLIATALERAHGGRTAMNTRMDLWDLREGQCRLMGEILRVREEVEGLIGGREGGGGGAVSGASREGRGEGNGGRLYNVVKGMMKSTSPVDQEGNHDVIPDSSAGGGTDSSAPDSSAPDRSSAGGGTEDSSASSSAGSSAPVDESWSAATNPGSRGSRVGSRGPRGEI